MGRPKKPKPKKFNKKEILFRLATKPKSAIREFMQREYTLLAQLEGIFGMEFLDQLRIPKTLPSLAILLSGPMREEMNAKFKVFKWVQKENTIQEVFDQRFGEDIITHKKLTLRDFIDGSEKQTKTVVGGCGGVQE